jgi:hypothetical protein
MCGHVEDRAWMRRESLAAHACGVGGVHRAGGRVGYRLSVGVIVISLFLRRMCSLQCQPSKGNVVDAIMSSRPSLRRSQCHNIPHSPMSPWR